MIQTQRLQLRQITLDDAPFMLRIYNDPDFIANVADKGLRTVADVERYLTEGTLKDYVERGFGLWLVLHQGEPIGSCGLLQRPFLTGPDIGYSFLPQARGQGFAREAAAACVEFAKTHAIDTLWAMVNPDNGASVKLLQSLGFVASGSRLLEGESNAVNLYRLNLAAQ